MLVELARSMLMRRLEDRACDRHDARSYENLVSRLNPSMRDVLEYAG